MGKGVFNGNLAQRGGEKKGSALFNNTWQSKHGVTLPELNKENVAHLPREKLEKGEKACRS